MCVSYDLLIYFEGRKNFDKRLLLLFLINDQAIVF